MIRLVKLEQCHLDGIQLQPKQDKRWFTGELGAMLLEQQFSFALVDDATTWAVGGAVETHDGVARMWVGIAEDAGTRLLMVIRWTQRAIESLFGNGFHRVEAHVKTDFAEAHRMVRLLGMEFEGIMRQYGPDREDYALYARVKDHG
jgi:hypothetical protein